MNPWLLAIRPKTLPASISPIVLSNVYCYTAFVDQFQWPVLILTLLAAIFIQIAVNLANDYFDFKKGVDTEHRVGPKRVSQSGLIQPKTVFSVMLLSTALAVACAGYLMLIGGLPIILLTVASVVCVIWYSGGPFPLASLGLGELTVFIFFGLVAVLATQYLHTGNINITGALFGSQMGLISAAIMLVNNIRDIDTDSAANKRTLVVRLGKPVAQHLYRFLLLLPFVLQTYLLLNQLVPIEMVVSFACLPLGLKLSRQIWQCHAETYNQQLAQTAKFLLFFALLSSAGLLVSGLY